MSAANTKQAILLLASAVSGLAAECGKSGHAKLREQVKEVLEGLPVEAEVEAPAPEPEIEEHASKPSKSIAPKAHK